MSHKIWMSAVWLLVGLLGVGCTKPQEVVGVAKTSTDSKTEKSKETEKVEKPGKKAKTKSSKPKRRSNKGKEYNSVDEAKSALKAKKGMIWFGDFDDLETANQSTPAQKAQWTCGYNSFYFSATHLSISALGTGLSLRYDVNKYAPSSVKMGTVNSFYRDTILSSKLGDFIDIISSEIPENELKKIDKNKLFSEILKEKGIDAKEIELCELAKIDGLNRYLSKKKCKVSVGPTPQLAVKAINDEHVIGDRFQAEDYAFEDFASLLEHIWKAGETQERGVVVLGFNHNSQLDGWHYMSIIGIEVDGGEVINAVMRNTNGDVKYWPVAKLEEWMDSQREKALSVGDRYLAKEILKGRFSGLFVLLNN
ncbi:MAG: hypothetical protein AAF320_01520 [Myxococcota bacterium]